MNEQITTLDGVETIVLDVSPKKADGSEVTFEDLSEDQRAAHDRIINNIKTGKHTVLTGGPGVGKTTLTKFVFNTLLGMGISGIRLTAPTHQAKNELSMAVGMDAETMHAALKISPVTNEEIRTFEQVKGKKAADLSECRVFTIDEVSMVGNDLHKIAIKTVPERAVMFGLGDRDQIRPVTQDGTTELSPFFTDPRYDVIKLDKIMRQAEGNPIIEISREVRDGKPLRPMVLPDGSGIHHKESVRDFMIAYFDRVKTPEDLKNVRMLAYTNASVDKLNAIIRKRIYKTEDPFVVGEVVVMQEPLVSEVMVLGQKFTEIIFNNNEKVEIVEIAERKEVIQCQGVSSKIELNYFVLSVVGLEEGNASDISIVHDKAESSKLHDYLNEVAYTYKCMKRDGQRAPWDSFWKLKNKFQSVKALPVCTYHKSQGSTYQDIFMYTPCALAYADPDLLKQLLYVGTTRARNSVTYI